MSELVSVIVPVYNMEKTLAKATRTILNQTYRDLEIILVDDGSADESYKVCRELAEQDPRVKVIHTENQGSGPARNTGIAASTGKYLYFPDADDDLEPEAISILVEATEGGKYDLIVFGYRYLFHDGSLNYEKSYEPFVNSGEDIRRAYADYFGMTNRFSIQGAPWNKFFSAQVVRQYGIEYPPLRRHQDEGFISRYVTYCKQVKFISDVLYHYTANSVSLEWKKYPADYINSVTGLNEVWNETIMVWNPEDHVSHRLVENNIFRKIIKVLELSYSPKMQFNFFSRLKWIRKVCRDTDFHRYHWEVAENYYHRLMLLCGKSRLYLLVMLGAYIGKLRSQLQLGK